MVLRANKKARGMNDEEDYPPEGGSLGIGSLHSVSERGVKKVKKQPIGFIHFPDKTEIPNKGTKRPKLGTRKKPKPTKRKRAR